MDLLGEYHEYIGDILNTSQDVQYIGGIPRINLGGRYHEYFCGYSVPWTDIDSTLERYHLHIGECSLYRRDTTVHVGEIS